MITITLRGDPGMRTGTIVIGEGVQAYQWPVVTWIKKEHDEVEAYTSDGKMITLATDAGRGGITIGKQFWFLRDSRWAGTVMTGTAMPGVSDAHMARDFPGCGWE